jgi:hypothetical protein
MKKICGFGKRIKTPQRPPPFSTSFFLILHKKIMSSLTVSAECLSSFTQYQTALKPVGECLLSVLKDFAPSNPYAAFSPPSMQAMQDWLNKAMKAQLPCMCNTNYLTSYDSYLRTCSQFDPAILTKGIHDACNGDFNSLFPLSNSGKSGSAAGSSTGGNNKTKTFVVSILATFFLVLFS